jgi:hypothetical protein
MAARAASTANSLAERTTKADRLASPIPAKATLPYGMFELEKLI